MSLVCFGLNNQSAPVSLLEKVSFSAAQMGEVLQDIRREPRIREVAGLSTCNRTEFYAVGRDPQQTRGLLIDTISRHRGLGERAMLHEHSYTHREESTARHLFRVAAGVDSLIIGEAQILGQIKRAHELALNVGTVGGTLNGLMHRAIEFGRKVRIQTNIGRGNVSVASVSLRLAQQAFPDLTERTLLVIGAGETARLSAQHFVKEGIGKLVILDRTLANARAITERLGGEVLGVDGLTTGLESADIVVCAVGAPHHIITREGLAALMERRAGRALVLVDLSMPRNIEAAVCELPGVTLHALESLQAIASENRHQRESEIVQVEALIEQETEEFVKAAQGAEAARLVAAIRRRVDETRLAHMDRYCSKLPDDERERIAKFSDSLLRAVLHDLTSHVRSLDTATEEGSRELEIVRALFKMSREKAEA